LNPHTPWETAPILIEYKEGESLSPTTLLCFASRHSSGNNKKGLEYTQDVPEPNPADNVHAEILSEATQQIVHLHDPNPDSDSPPRAPLALKQTIENIVLEHTVLNPNPAVQYILNPNPETLPSTGHPIQ
jgi:hypothetical protein